MAVFKTERRKLILYSWEGEVSPKPTRPEATGSFGDRALCRALFYAIELKLSGSKTEQDRVVVLLQYY
jgi:hypothetical protein